MSATLQERMKRMEVYDADKKQRQIRLNLPDPEMEFSSEAEMNIRFKEMQATHSASMVSFERKPEAVAAALTQGRSILKRARESTNSAKAIHRGVRPSTGSNTSRKSMAISRNINHNDDKQQLTQSSTTLSMTSIHPRLNSIEEKSKRPAQKLMNNFLQQQSNQQTGIGKTQTTTVGLGKQALNSMLSTTAGIITRLQSGVVKQKTASINQSKLQITQRNPSPLVTNGHRLSSSSGLMSTPNRRLSSMELLKGTAAGSSTGNVRFGPIKQKDEQVKSSVSLKEDKQPTMIDIEDRIGQSPEWQIIQKKLKAQMISKKSQEKSEDSYINPLVKLFGNNFIAMVMQALVVKKIDDIYGVKINTDSNVPISDNVLRSFGISPIMLNSINSAKDRNEYIADTMALRITMMMKEWDERQAQRQTRFIEVDAQEEKEANQRAESNKDMFDWLKVDTNHEKLQIKLRMSIIERLTDFDNQEEIVKKIRQVEPSVSSRIDQSRLIGLKDMPSISAKVLLLRMNEVQNRHLKADLNPEQLKLFEELKNTGMIESESSEFNSLPDWNEDLEREFLRNKKQAKIIYSNDISASNWTKQGYIPLVQEYNLSNKKKMERESLTEQYQNGCWLTEKELKFIADTSALMNKCIDKNHVQNIVDIIRSDDISQLELSLAETIISNYENMQKMIREKRREFLQARLKRAEEERKERVLKEILTEEREKKAAQRQKVFRMIKTIGEGLLSKKTIDIMKAFKTNFFLRLFFQKIKDALTIYRKKKEIAKQQSYFKRKSNSNTQRIPQNINTTNTTITPANSNVPNSNTATNPVVINPAKVQVNTNKSSSKSRKSKESYFSSKDKVIFVKSHELHPPSKLSHFAESEEVVDLKRIKSIQFMIDGYRLTSRSKPEMRIKGNFQKYYSGGPIIESDEPLDIHKQPLTRKQLNGIIKVQMMFRQMRTRRIMKELIQSDFDTKQKEYEEWMWRYKWKKRFAETFANMQAKNKYLKKGSSMQAPIDNADQLESFYSSSDEEQNYKKPRKHLITRTSKAAEALSQLKAVIPTAYSSQKNISMSFIPSSSNLPFETPMKQPSNNNINNNNNNFTSNNKQIERNVKLNTQSNSKTVSSADLNTAAALPSATLGSNSVGRNTKADSVSKMESARNFESIFTSNSIEPTNHQVVPIGESGDQQHLIRLEDEDEVSGILETENENIQGEIIPSTLVRIESPEKAAIDKSEQRAVSREKKKNDVKEQVKRMTKVKQGPTVLLLKQMKLLEAAKQNRFVSIKNAGYVLNEKDVACVDAQGNSALFYAITNQNLEFIRWLLIRNADINQVCSGGNTPIHQAFKTNNEKILFSLLNLNPDLNAVNEDEMTPMAYSKPETLRKCNLEHVIVTKNASLLLPNEFLSDNNEFLDQTSQPKKAIGKVRLNHFYPLQCPTVFQDKFTSL